MGNRGIVAWTTPEPALLSKIDNKNLTKLKILHDLFSTFDFQFSVFSPSAKEMGSLVRRSYNFIVYSLSNTSLKPLAFKNSFASASLQ